MPRYKGVIFDFNGVLIFDSLWQEKSWQKVLSRLSGKSIDLKKVRVLVHGKTVSEVLEEFLNRPLDKKELDLLTKEKELYYQQLCLSEKENFKLVDGANHILNWLKIVDIPVTIATSASRLNMEFYFKHLKLSQWFNWDLIVYDDGNLRSKPSPEPYIVASKKLNLKPSDCIVIEDSEAGIKSAKKAGIGYIIAMAGERKPTRYIKKNANIIIKDLSELPIKFKK
ncbi:MAG: HAD family phosphatase [Deferribacterota bacterium]|nr:HAD family phosphatase [Deferribacterota bacterium]